MAKSQGPGNIPHYKLARLTLHQHICTPHTILYHGNLQWPLDSLTAHKYSMNQFSSVQSLSHVRLFATPWITAHQASHPSQLPEFTQTHIYRVSDAIQPSHPLVVPFSSCPQSLPVSESFPMNQLFAWGGQSTGVSALALFLPKNTQGWSPSEWTGWISLQSKGLSGVFSNTTVQKHQFFGTQPSSQSNSHIHTWPQEKP